MSSRVMLGRVMLGVGVAGVVASLAGIVVGWQLLTGVHDALDRSLTLTGEALEALDASVAVAQDAAGHVEAGLEQSEQTARDLVVTFREGRDILDATADLTEQEIAASLDAVEQSLPALIQVAAVMDRTLEALSALPFGPPYDPEEPFDESLRAVERELSGLPGELRAQADLVRDAGERLDQVGDGAEAMAGDLAVLRTSLRQAARLLQGYEATAAEASALVTGTRQDLSGQVRAARVTVVALGLTLLAGQAVPLSLGWLLLRPEAVGALLEASRRGTA